MKYYVKKYVKNVDDNKKQKLLINIGIGACIISIVCGLMIFNLYTLTMILPLWYLTSLKNKQSSKMVLKKIEMELNTEQNEIIFKNCDYRNMSPCSFSYSYNSSDDVSLYYDYQNEVMILEGYLQKKVLQDGKESDYHNDFFKIDMIVSPNDAEAMAEEMGLSLKQMRK